MTSDNADGASGAANPETDSPLKETIVKDALEKLAWKPLRRHLDEVGCASLVVEDLLGHFRRAKHLVVRHPSARCGRRDQFVAALDTHLRRHAGDEAADRLAAIMAAHRAVEAGYHEILAARAACDASKLSPEARANAALAVIALEAERLQEAVNLRLNGPEAPMQSLQVDLGTIAGDPDGILADLNRMCASMLQMEAHEAGWFDGDGKLVLPDLRQPKRQDLETTGYVLSLAGNWHRWERVHKRWRFLGGDLAPIAVPAWAPPSTQAAFGYRAIDAIERLDLVANTRLHDRVLQTFIEMSLKTKAQARAAGIRRPVPLPPARFVSVEEVHAGGLMRESLAFDIMADQSLPGGLRLVEWIRGYAVLQCLARARHEAKGINGLLTTIARCDLVALLRRLGLSESRATSFVDHVSLDRDRSDLFDQPLVRTTGNRLLVFGPALLTIAPAAAALSRISRLDSDLSRKGPAFEADIRAFLACHGIIAHGFKKTVDGEEYEIDVVFEWQGHVFLFECKNHALSGNNPAGAYYFQMEQRGAAKQVRRQAAMLKAHPEVLLEKTGIDPVGKPLVLGVLNALPYAIPGGLDGIFVTDASAFRRFFQEKHFHVVRPHAIADGATLGHRTALAAFWAGDKPCPADLIRQLQDPFQVGLVGAHLDMAESRSLLGTATAFAADEFARREFSIDSMAQHFGIQSDPIRAEIGRVGRIADRVRRKRQSEDRRKADSAAAIALREATRRWRDPHRRPRT